MDLQEAFDRGFEVVKTYVDAELAAAAMLPPELAVEVAKAVRTLHEAPEMIERSEPAAPPKVVRIERDDDGNLVPIYDEPRPAVAVPQP